jgi:murein L,D-transpeptidase YcbB/YkuD
MIKSVLILVSFLPFFSVSQTGSANPADKLPDWQRVIDNLPDIVSCLEKADSFGLIKELFDYNYINELKAQEKELVNATDSQKLTVRILDAFTRYVDNALNGNVPEFSYNGLYYTNSCIEAGQRVREALANSTVSELLTDSELQSLNYQNLKVLYRSLLDSIDNPSYPATVLSRKLRAVAGALNSVRWMNCLLQKNEFTIVVNIPSATLLLYNHGEPILESKVIVGKRTTRTPIFASVLTDITIYPYWMVPKSIATKELLPEIKKDIDYIERNGFQIVDAKGRVIEPDSVKWSALSKEYFPYTIRQSTGCDNSLGLIKLNIHDPFNVYLHDTPWKVLFESQRRFFSHGCIRVQKAKELSAYLLKENRIAVDTLDESKQYVGKNPRILSVKNKVPVLVLYNTAWFDAKGTVRFFPDIYSKF